MSIIEHTRSVRYIRFAVTDTPPARWLYRRPPSRTDFGALLRKDEIHLLSQAFVQCGVRKIRLTGEPLRRADIIDICLDISSLAGLDELCISTDGLLLDEMALQLAAAGVKQVSVNIPAMDRSLYRKMTGVDGLDAALAGICNSVSLFDRVKINCVVMRGVNDRDITALAAMSVHFPIEVRFIELMPIAGRDDWKAAYMSASEILPKLSALGRMEELAEDSPHATAKRYRLWGAAGKIGVVAPVSNIFCQSCDRMRVTAVCQLKPCLRLPVKVDLRPILASDAPVEKLQSLLAKCADIKYRTPVPIQASESALC